VAREKDRHHLVAELTVIHRLTCLLVTRMHQHREQVAGVFTAAAALMNHLEDNAIERGERPPEPDIRWRREPLWDLDDPGHRPVTRT